MAHAGSLLPFRVNKFREKSVMDRSGKWGALYAGIFEPAIAAVTLPEGSKLEPRRLVRDAERAGDLIELESIAGDDDAAYVAATRTIIEHAERLAVSRDDDPVAITVWEGQVRSGNDLTDAFRRLAGAAGFKPVTVLTT